MKRSSSLSITSWCRPDTKHDDAGQLPKALYRHMMTRRDVAPTQLGGFVYTNEAQFTTPLLSPWERDAETRGKNRRRSKTKLRSSCGSRPNRR